ncbi:hypothetical protein BTR22_01810 [Alkalihalophilus pseudofirmus]|uniref:molybdenum cofactor guanylyltransferase n=1 Tax=Alkalihalophilus pseudofirmus TaxID=79885 RepID=UPI00095290F9|nr:hypothetical protein BTR22_01810 [Alkalihalophilus pseudofirmus]
MERKYLGVVLAGGQSRRYGRQKALAYYQSKPFFMHSLDALKDLTEEQLIICHPAILKDIKAKTKTSVVLDHPKYQGLGPLAGLYTAMSTKDAEWYVTAPCDTPYIHTDVYKKLIKIQQETTSQAIIPIIEGRKQPLIGLYHKSLQHTISQLLDQEIYKVGALLEAADTYLAADSSFDPEAFHNVNKPEDWPEAKLD